MQDLSTLFMFTDLAPFSCHVLLLKRQLSLSCLFMWNWLNMLLHISFSGCLKRTLLAKISNSFMFGFVMLHEMNTLSSFIITFLTRNPHFPVNGINVVVQARFAFTSVSTFLTLDKIAICLHFTNQNFLPILHTTGLLEYVQYT